MITGKEVFEKLCETNMGKKVLKKDVNKGQIIRLNLIEQKIGAIIVVRNTSSRLPQKAIKKILGKETISLLIERIKIELPEFNMSKIKVIKKNDNEINLISGPYNTVNLMKNDYILLKKFGFEDLEISANE